ncbi:hypothetical protein BEP19_03620 [Ammoniphilus oxalaticus]|uniref:DUF559 domain-containing protein n=1 Tax=Ammoniphilus oxalaticus TaxID=66863 RepID=A0A419SLI6_9BACL|nr:winged helix-turn-helix transcriptional regulator [Ammoniphilus oxalaticus]RKD24937.1 hypothetical protein BEP19_03620 [Ammoniphilus oxalaticus]
MLFDEAYSLFLKKHIRLRKGECRQRLEDGLGYAEKLFLMNVWWPLFQQFQHLHPEYEVYDFKDGKRYIDFAYIRPNFKICFEIDGYGPHAKDISRWQFSDQLTRQNHLVIDGWHIIRFSVDQVQNEPRQCQQTSQLVIGRLLGQAIDNTPLSIHEKEVVRLALSKGKSITNKEVQARLGLSDKPVRKILKDLVEKGLLSPTSRNARRIHSYQLTERFRSPFLKQL